VVGVGNPYRGDDGVGLAVVEELRRRATPDLELMAVPVPTRLVDAWQGWDDVVVVDAIRSGRPPGSVVVDQAAERSPPRAGGTHGFGVRESIELARGLGRLPARLTVVGVEAASVAVGSELSEAVAAAVGRAADEVVAVLCTRGWSVALSWIPLGAGDRIGLVRASGRLFELLQSRRDHRRPGQLFHSALEVTADGVPYTVEMAPAWSGPRGDRGVVCSGPVGLRSWGRSRWFRYEVRLWRDGVIPDLDARVGPPMRLSTDSSRVRALLDLAASFPTLTWGRDERGYGEMWNSNSLVSWLLARSGHELGGVDPPGLGRAPGWAAGLRAAGSRISGPGGAGVAGAGRTGRP